MALNIPKININIASSLPRNQTISTKSPMRYNSDDEIAIDDNQKTNHQSQSSVSVNDNDNELQSISENADHNNNVNQNWSNTYNVSEDNTIEKEFLHQNGYIKLNKITDTLQGSVFTALNTNNNSIIVIKRASKILHLKGITINNGKTYKIKENILNEYKIGKIFTNNKKCPIQITKTYDLIESKNNYYLIMENSGSDFFKFIVKAHQLILDNKLSIKEWKKFVKFLFYQMILVVYWLHNVMNCCHLDISLENMTVINGNFIATGNGDYTIDPKITIKFVDFGLAEFFDPNQGFYCIKFCGKTKYKAPEVFAEMAVFDARSADIWSLSVVLFTMLCGCPPYVHPSDQDERYKYFIKNGFLCGLLCKWKKTKYFNVKTLHLVSNMMRVDANSRYLAIDVMKHPWLSCYYNQFVAKNN